MDKTGFSQADFAISFAIFLVYLMFIFVYLKPVSLPSVSSDVLLSIVENNLIKESSWSITKTPLFIDCNACIGTSAIPEDQFCLEDFPFADWGSNFYFWDNNNLDIEAEYPFSQSSTDYPQYDCNNGLAFEYDAANGINTFWAVRSDNEIWDGALAPFSCGKIVTGTSICEFLDAKKDSPDYKAYFGATDFLTGISLEKFNKLDETAAGYSALKPKWGFPAEKDFSVYLFDVASGVELASYNKNMETKSSAKEIFVREWSDFLLGIRKTPEAGISTTSVIINIRIW